MAKKTVAGFRDKSKSKGFTKVMVAVKNKETGSYYFKEEIVPSDMVQDYLKNNK